MTWQAYVDNQICSHVQTKLAIIAGLQDGSIWAKQENSDKEVTHEELKLIADTIRTNPFDFLKNGIYLAGEKYYGLSAEQNLIRGRKGSAALCIVATNACLLVVVTQDGFPPGVLNSVVERLGDYLRSSNY